MTLYIPATYCREDSRSLIFLLGPIEGAPRWQTVAAQWFRSNTDCDRVDVASPRYISLDDEDTLDWAPHISSQNQIDWEIYHLSRANKNGVIMAWLPPEEKVIPERCYAQTSRFELGEQLARHSLRNINLVVGVEAGFSGEGYVAYRIGQVPTIPLRFGLEETCKAVLELLPKY